MGTRWLEAEFGSIQLPGSHNSARLGSRTDQTWRADETHAFGPPWLIDLLRGQEFHLATLCGPGALLGWGCGCLGDSVLEPRWQLVERTRRKHKWHPSPLLVN
jgi:hypothetical protein